MVSLAALVIFLIAEFVLLFYHPVLSFSLFACAFIVFLTNGGYNYIKIAILTLPRDFKALIYMIKLKRTLSRCSREEMTIAGLFEETAQRHAEKLAIIFEDVRWTFSDLSRYANGMAYFLSSDDNQGLLKKGDVVAVFMETRPEYIGTWLGVCKTGSIAALINYNQRNDALVHSIKVANSKAIICGEEVLPALDEVIGQLDSSVPIFVVPKMEGPPSSPKFQETKEKLGEFKTVGLSYLAHYMAMGVFKPPPGKIEDTILYIYTSGTTGLPKAAKITTSRYVAFSSSFHTFGNLTHNDTIYVFLPIYHSNGGILGVGQCVVFGSAILLKKKFSASQFWDDCVKHKCKGFTYIGEICRYLLAQPVRPAESQHCVQYATGNGLRESIWEEFQSRFNINHIIEFYGSTEGNANTVNFSNRVGAVGFISRINKRAYPISLIKVNEAGEALRDPKTGLCIECEPGEQGEMVGKIDLRDSLRRFDGYATSADTQRKIVRDVFNKGDMFFKTGDILVMDELGFVFFRDRTGDTFRWRGENVSTQEVEGAVSSVTGLRDAAVYGVVVPGVEGRAGMAAIVDSSKELDITGDLAARLMESLPSYSVPVFLRLMESIPSTGTYKFVKGSLQKEGFNPDLVGKDPLFYLDISQTPRKYVPLTREMFEKINSGKMRL